MELSLQNLKNDGIISNEVYQTRTRSGVGSPNTETSNTSSNKPTSSYGTPSAYGSTYGSAYGSTSTYGTPK